MRWPNFIMVTFILASCSSRQPSWDSGAQKQEAIEEETQAEQQERLRNQFPGRPLY